MTKLDVKAAYRRLHAAADTALASLVVIVGAIALMGLWLLFGASATQPKHLEQLIQNFVQHLQPSVQMLTMECYQYPQDRITAPGQICPSTNLPSRCTAKNIEGTRVDSGFGQLPYTDVYLDDFAHLLFP
jgi:hypothetical protein